MTRVLPMQLNFQFGCVGRRVSAHEAGVDEVNMGVDEVGVGEAEGGVMADARRGRGAQTTRADEAAVSEAGGRGEAGERTRQAQARTRRQPFAGAQGLRSGTGIAISIRAIGKAGGSLYATTGIREARR
ncbi:hypothetical protein DFH09DRAFT_1100442 [Mycena vulgaris]|nr:hypothetical protein DFH09DRAFT_1100442 [Mycena vulgaris]